MANVSDRLVTEDESLRKAKDEICIPERACCSNLFIVKAKDDADAQLSQCSWPTDKWEKIVQFELVVSSRSAAFQINERLPQDMASETVIQRQHLDSARLEMSRKPI
ncbi:hypothetical protein F2P81_006999 [Scophthalmus maximus]|uniref:Uncharacterized protein n=1 Tax=Scophthalmus maximus TaxID=52904 RepID=A0A6A4TE32_SCOMX|nr:hypothetical protein F2P81_006999 [Scophthalmus maximus]